MNFDMLYKGKERQEYTEYSENLKDLIRKLFEEIKDSENFTGNVQMFGDKLLSVKFHQHLQLSVVFDYEPGKSIVTFEKKHFDLTHLKLGNLQSIDLIKRIIEDEILILEHRVRILTMLFPFIFIKIMTKDEFEEKKNRYLSRKGYLIYTGSKIIKN